MWPHGWQSFGSNARGMRETHRCPLRGRRHGRPHHRVGPHRCRGRQLGDQRPRCQRQTVLDGRTNPRRFLPRQKRTRTSHQPWRCLRTLCRLGLVRDRCARHRLCPRVRASGACVKPRQIAVLQLLAIFQLEEELERQANRDVPRRAVSAGLQVSVHHFGGYSYQLVQHLPIRPRIRQWRRHEALRQHGARA